jgi:tRNA threonylcarbamoyladenosine biosynthesis protein TsaB
MAELAIDTAADVAGVALTSGGALVSELTWRTRQNQSRELLPALEWLLQRSGLTRSDIEAVFVCTGPGSYAGLRVGLSTAKGLAYGMDIAIVGVGRLTADAAMVAVEDGRRIVAVHAAGRAELAWAAYERRDRALIELEAPRLSPRVAFAEGLGKGDVVVGELDEALRENVIARGAGVAPPGSGRVVAVARLGWLRLQSGAVDSADSLVPLYLREPAIGPQPAPS